MGQSENVTAALKKADFATDAEIYQVKPGDSLWAISRRYNISVTDLCAVNNIKADGILSINQTLMIPVFK